MRQGDASASAQAERIIAVRIAGWRFVRSTVSGMFMVVVTIVTVVGAMNAAVDNLVSVMMSALRREPMQTMTQDCDAAVGGNQQNCHELSGSASRHEISKCWQKLREQRLF